VKVTQLSSSHGLQVYSKTISSTSHPYSGCGFAGCSSGYVGSTEAGIAVAQPDGSEERVLTSGGYDTAPSFSPDGETIAYLRHQEGGHGAAVDAVGLMSWDGVPVGALRPPDGWTYASPVWSPDGTSIAVERRSTSAPDELAGASGVMVLPLDGGPARQVASGPFRDLAWSHSGRELAGIRTRYVRYGTRTAWQPGDHSTGEDVWVIPLDGSTPRNVSNLAPAQEPSTFCETNLSPVRANQPAWSPDDAHIAFLESATYDVSSGGVSDVGVVDSSGRHRVTVYSSPRPAHCDPHTGMSQAPRVEIVAVLGWS
jgi:Tol biopolymer transport system component